MLSYTELSRKARIYWIKVLVALNIIIVYKLVPKSQLALSAHDYVIVKERHETIMGYKPRERVALEWFIPIIVELLVL